MSEYDEAVGVLRVLAGQTEPSRYRTYRLFEDEAAAILARIAELEAAIGQLSDAHRATAADLGECKERARRLAAAYDLGEYKERARRLAAAYNGMYEAYLEMSGYVISVAKTAPKMMPPHDAIARIIDGMEAGEGE